jgi:hypothetical protein
MFKHFLMDNAHHSHIQYLFRWWNGHVFSFDTPGRTGREDHREDSGMDEALKALDSDDDFGGDANSWYVQDEPDIQHDEPEIQYDEPEIQRDKLSIDFFNLTLSDHGLIAPSIPVAPENTIVAAQVHESTPPPGMVAPRIRYANTIIAPHIHQSTHAPSIAALRIREPMREPIHTNTIASQVRESTPAPTIVTPHICEPTPAPQYNEPTHENAFVAPRVCGSILTNVPQPLHETTPALPSDVPSMSVTMLPTPQPRKGLKSPTTGRKQKLPSNVLEVQKV